MSPKFTDSSILPIRNQTLKKAENVGAHTLKQDSENLILSPSFTSTYFCDLEKATLLV